ncbi:MAG: sugar O-acetyltransferase [Oscillospiraceae bacterium]
MTEKEKMLSGKPYLGFDEDLVKERLQSRKKVHEFNTAAYDDITTRTKIIVELFGSAKKDFFIEPPFRCDYGSNIIIGENFYANFNCTMLDCATITIGDNVLIAPNVSLFTAGHPIHPQHRKAFEYAFPIVIGNDVWIGGGAIINPGVIIGDNTVIASGSVVTKDIPANVVAGGNPCKVIREINQEDKIRYFKGHYL